MILVSVPSSNYGSNTREFESAPLDPAWTRMRVTLTRENWPGTTSDVIGSIALAVAEDGVNYPSVSGASIDLLGGSIIQRGIPLASQYVECTLPGAGLVGRKIKAVFVNTQTIRTSVTVEAT